MNRPKRNKYGKNLQVRPTEAFEAELQHLIQTHKLNPADFYRDLLEKGLAVWKQSLLSKTETGDLEAK